MWDQLWHAPMHHPTSVLDVGCGTGIWALAVADIHPAALITGIDISPIQPTLVHPSVTFQVHDLEEDWDMPERYDLIHTQMGRMSGV